MTPYLSGIYALLIIGSLALIVVALWAPVERKAQRDPAFAARIDRFMDWLFR